MRRAVSIRAEKRDEESGEEGQTGTYQETVRMRSLRVV
jgi:hypothetical protein